MKANIHPKLVESQVICACGNRFTTRSVKPVLRVEVCSNCHPFFTGQQRIVDTAGRVERFMQRIAAKQEDTTQRRTGKRAMRRSRYLETEALAAGAGEEGEESSAEESEGQE